MFANAKTGISVWLEGSILRLEGASEDFYMRCLHYLALALLVATESAAQKPRVVVTTDPELDDSNSLVRYLLFSTDFRTEGLIYASSQFHWKGDGTGKK